MEFKKIKNTELSNFLDRNDYNWVTVLIDNVNSEISIFDICSGLNEDIHLNDEDKELIKENPNEVIYIELHGIELMDLVGNYDFYITDIANSKN